MSGVAVHRVVEGHDDGPVVVFSNSIGSDLRMWEPQVAPLVERGYRVVRYDTRGHGASPVPDGPYDLADLGGDVLALLDDLGAERAHLVGLSLGGMTGMWLGVHAAERLRSLTLCCTSAKLGPAQMWADRAKLVRAEGTGAVAEAGVGRWVTPAYARSHPDEVAFLRGMMTDCPDEGYAACCGVIERMDQLAGLPKITTPTLVISGADDPATPPDPHGKLIAEGIPGARFEVVASAAHLGNYEQPEEFTRLILEQITEAV
ncbi:3-oxoadipate enol-lactonase [Amycolatopsis sp. NPDC049253]|uniref:3-oxoadipate enol-lactonase n=1 Tax=Amycolatopsis sp. NPDC049253 TaxID=3155274 RepID=UPI00341E93F4